MTGSSAYVDVKHVSSCFYLFINYYYYSFTIIGTVMILLLDELLNKLQVFVHHQPVPFISISRQCALNFCIFSFHTFSDYPVVILFSLQS